MATEVEIPDVGAITPTTRTRRTWRGQLESPAGADPTTWWCKAHREEADYNANGDLLSTNPRCERSEVRRTAAQIATQEFTTAGVTVTGAQLLALVAKAFDTFDEEDAANPPPVGP